jgi:hypothetical protein
MIKRPLDKRFREAVLDGRKTTTIRDKAWPVGVPIMLYNWSDVAYRSRQLDVCPVMVRGWWTIRITHNADGTMTYECGKESGAALHEGEGFASRGDMDNWFRARVGRGGTVVKKLMLFRRTNNHFRDETQSTAEAQQTPCNGVTTGRAPQSPLSVGTSLHDVSEQSPCNGVAAGLAATPNQDSP